IIFISDGDIDTDKGSKNYISLPGGFRPETLMYRHLFSLAGSDPFWHSCGPNYNRQVAITSQGGKLLSTGDDKKWVKKWYKSETRQWGDSDSKIIKSGITHNRELCVPFCTEVLALIKARYIGSISMELEKSCLDLFRKQL